MSTPGRCNSSTANITCNSHMAWLLTTVLSDWAGQQTRVTPPFSPCAHAAMSPAAAPSSIYQLCATRPLEAWMVNQPLGSPHRAAYLYGTAILPYCHTATTIIPRHSRSVLQGIFSQINPVHLADASAILQRPLSYRVRHIGTDPAMSTPGRCNSSTANITCNSHMAWLLTTVLSDWAGQQTRVTPPFSPCAHAAMSPAAAPSSIYQLCATRPLEAWMVNQPLGSPHRAAYLYGTVLYR